jgi:hypothetical protein
MIKNSVVLVLLVAFGIHLVVSQALLAKPRIKGAKSSSLFKRRATGKNGKAGSSAEEEEDDDDDDFKGIEEAETLCLMFETFDNVGGKNACDDFDPLDVFLCPDDDAVEDICDENKPHKNKAVKSTYCEPLFEDLEEGRADNCTMYCTGYVSKKKDDCCDLACDDR